MVSGDALKARRHAREIVAEMRWRGMTVPPLYARMAVEFEDLVHNGDYPAWVAASHTPAVMGRTPHGAGLPRLVRLDWSGAGRATSRARRTATPHAPRRGFPLPGPASGR
jgi:hypothetical protein